MQETTNSDPDFPAPNFEELIHNTVQQWLDHNPNAHGSEFIVPVIQEHDGRVTCWGIVDILAIPREDVYVEVAQRIRGAYRIIGWENIFGFGLADMELVTNRAPLGAFKPPQF